jgi:hypothetical protein
VSSTRAILVIDRDGHPSDLRFESGELKEEPSLSELAGLTGNRAVAVNNGYVHDRLRDEGIET